MATDTQTYAAGSYAGMGSSPQFTQNGSTSNSKQAHLDGVALNALTPASGLKAFATAVLHGARLNPENFNKTSSALAQFALAVATAVNAISSGVDPVFKNACCTSVCANTAYSSKSVADLAIEIIAQATVLATNNP